MLTTLLTVLYAACAILLSLYALGSLVLLAAHWRHRRDELPTPPVDDWPGVAVQLPVYNERFVVERLLQAVASLDYPRDRLTVQVLDDSTDETSEIIAARVALLRQSGLSIEHIRRDSRQGYKAGALAYGLQRLDAEYVVILDADFVLPPDFLRKTLPHLIANPRVGMIQTRWGHLNAAHSLLTRGQALALDGHFAVEQTARSRSGWLINFNGSGGVWRRRAIEDAGGWKDLTLTEDLDLSYRAQLKGWRFLYLPSVEVPGELPQNLAAYKQQQARWARGGTQCMVSLLPAIWREARLTLAQRTMATMHLCQHLNAPLMILLLLLTPVVLALTGMKTLPLGPLGLAGLGPPLLYAASQQALYLDWKRRLLSIPVLMLLGTGTALNNAAAVTAGLVSKRGEFKRTPKYGNSRSADRHYRLRGGKMILVEAGLSAYALAGTLLAVRIYPPLVPYLVVYCLAFGFVAVWGFTEQLNSDPSRRQAQALT